METFTLLFLCCLFKFETLQRGLCVPPFYLFLKARFPGQHPPLLGGEATCHGIFLLPSADRLWVQIQTPQLFTSFSRSKKACADSAWIAAEEMDRKGAKGLGAGLLLQPQRVRLCAWDWTCLKTSCTLLPETIRSLQSLCLRPLIGLLWFPGCKVVFLECRDFFVLFEISILSTHSYVLD